MSHQESHRRDGIDGTSIFDSVIGEIADTKSAFSHVPEHGFSLFLAKRTKRIHFVRHAEGTHNAANKAYGDDTPVTFSTDGAWEHQDAKLTQHGIEQCLEVRTELLNDVNPELIVVSPFTRTLQTAHILFSGSNIPFLVHDACGERRGKYTCDKRRDKATIISEMKPIYEYTGDTIDFESFAYETESDEIWTEEREADSSVKQRGFHLMRWLSTRPEDEIVVVSHSSWLKHLFREFGDYSSDKDQKQLHRLAGNAEIRSCTLCCHKGFYPEGEWEEEGEGEVFVPSHHSFRKGKYKVSDYRISKMHERLHNPENRRALKEHESMPI